MQACAQHAHGGLFQPAALPLRHNDHRFGSVRLGDALRDRVTDEGRTEILVLHVEMALRGGDHVGVEVADLVHAGLAVERRRGTRDRHVNVRDVGTAVFGPRVAASRDCHRARAPADRTEPPLARELADDACRFAVHHGLDVVERSVRLAVRIATTRIVCGVLARVPAAGRHVDPAAIGEAIVDDNHLLMMRGGWRVVGVEHHPQPPMRFPRQPIERQDLPVESEDDGEVPA